MPATADPLILTLALEEAAFTLFDGLRRRHFPPERNWIPAHATLFHHLPGAAEGDILETVGRLARAEPAPEVAVTGLRFTGRGVAYALDAPALTAFRARLATIFDGALSAQDRQGWRPHVTIQNKVAPETARALHARLEPGFVPFRFVARGLILWRYLGGPWQERARLPFGAEDVETAP